MLCAPEQQAQLPPMPATCACCSPARGREGTPVHKCCCNACGPCRRVEELQHSGQYRHVCLIMTEKDYARQTDLFDAVFRCDGSCLQKVAAHMCLVMTEKDYARQTEMFMFIYV